MNKYKLLTKQTVRAGVTSAIMIVVCIVIYVGASFYSDSVAKDKTDAENKLASETSTLANLRDQMEKSGAAEKRYAGLQQDRVSQEYYNTPEEFQKILGALAKQYKITDTKIGRWAKEVPSDKPELKNFEKFNIFTRPVHLEMKGISDMHIFSFLQALQAAVPGIIRVDMLSLKNTSEMVEGSFRDMGDGKIPIHVDAIMDLTWITVAPKAVKPAEGEAAAAGAAGAAAPPTP